MPEHSTLNEPLISMHKVVEQTSQHYIWTININALSGMPEHSTLNEPLISMPEGAEQTSQPWMDHSYQCIK